MNTGHKMFFLPFFIITQHQHLQMHSTGVNRANGKKGTRKQRFSSHINSVPFSFSLHVTAVVALLLLFSVWPQEDTFARIVRVEHVQLFK